MFAGAPTSVLLLAVLGMLVVAVSTLRLTLSQRPGTSPVMRSERAPRARSSA